jgi:two-component system, LytTR family, response regulator LytT
MNWNILIIEDEKPAARLLQRKMQKLGYEIATLLHSVESAIEWLSKNPHPDLILLDIQLSDGLSFEIFEHVTLQSAIIFTTAYDEYALKAFKLNSIDYLLKPIDEDELQKAMEKFEKNHAKSSTIPLAQLQQLLIPKTVSISYKKRFTIKVGEHLKIFPIEQIQCFYSENKATYLQTLEGRNYLLENTLEQLEQMLDPQLFFRINRSCIVHLSEIQDIIAYTNSRLKVVLKKPFAEDLIVSRERVNEFKEWLQ